MRRIIQALGLGLLLAGSAALAAGNVTEERVLKDGATGTNWFLKGGDFSGSHYSPLDNIDAAYGRQARPRLVCRPAGAGRVRDDADRGRRRHLPGRCVLDRARDRRGHGQGAVDTRPRRAVAAHRRSVDVLARAREPRRRSVAGPRLRHDRGLPAVRARCRDGQGTLVGSDLRYRAGLRNLGFALRRRRQGVRRQRGLGIAAAEPRLCLGLCRGRRRTAVALLYRAERRPEGERHAGAPDGGEDLVARGAGESTAAAGRTGTR